MGRNNARKRLLAPRVGASKRILALRLGNGTPLYFSFFLGANNLIIGKGLMAPRVSATNTGVSSQYILDLL